MYSFFLKNIKIGKNKAKTYKDFIKKQNTAINEVYSKICLSKTLFNFPLKNTKIRYMESMPVVENIHGFAKIKNEAIEFTINSGQSQNLNIKNGIVKLKDLDSDLENADVFLEKVRVPLNYPE